MESLDIFQHYCMEGCRKIGHIQYIYIMVVVKIEFYSLILNVCIGCKDNNKFCKQWADMNLCTSKRWAESMKIHCAKSCGC